MEHAGITGNLHPRNSPTQPRRPAPLIMAGDSYAFVDPISSSGVYLRHAHREQAAGVVDGALREPASERARQRAYRRQVDAARPCRFIYRSPRRDEQPVRHPRNRPAAKQR